MIIFPIQFVLFHVKFNINIFARAISYLLMVNGYLIVAQTVLKIRISNNSYETSFQKLELVLSWATLHFVGWVEPTPCFVGFRCTQANLHFAAVIANCKTQKRPIPEPSPKSFFFD